MIITKSDIRFKVGKKKIEFSIYNDLPEYGLNIEAAVHCWTARTNEYTAFSFVQYLLDKEPVCIALTERKYYKKIGKLK